MNLLSFKSISKRDVDSSYEKRLAQYQEILDQYKKILKQHMYESSHQMLEDTSRDLAQLKEQNQLILEYIQQADESKEEVIFGNIEKMSESLKQVYGKLDGLDKAIAEDTCKVFFDLQNQAMYQIKEMHGEMCKKADVVTRKVKGVKILLGLFLLLQLFTIAGIVLIIIDRLQLIAI